MESCLSACALIEARAPYDLENALGDPLMTWRQPVIEIANRDIAHRLHISERTVRHVSSRLRKLEARCRWEASLEAREFLGAPK
jgi:hypothetical protein